MKRWDKCPDLLLVLANLPKLPLRVGNLDKSGKSETVRAGSAARRPVIGVPRPPGTSEALHVGVSSSPRQEAGGGGRHLKQEGDTREGAN